MSNDASDTQTAPVARSSTAEGTLQVADTGGDESTRVVNVEIDRMVLSWPDNEYKTRGADTFNARRLCMMFSDGSNLFMVTSCNVRRDTYIGARVRLWKLLQR